MYAWLAQFILTYRAWILAASLAAAGVFATAVPHLGFDFTPQQLFGSTSATSEYREEFAQRFGREDNLVVVVVEGDDVLRADVLDTMRAVTHDLRALPMVSHADSIATLAIPRPGESPGSLSVEPPLPQPTSTAGPPVTQAQAEKLRQTARAEPLVMGRFVNESMNLAVVLAWLERDLQDAGELQDSVAAIDKILAAHPLPDGYAYDMGGIPGLRANIIESLQSEQLTFLPLTGLIFIIVLSWLFRKPSGVLLPLITVALAVLATVALLVWTGHSINIVNNVLPTLIFVIGISDSVHMLTRDAEETEAGRSRPEAVKAAIRHTGLACLLTSTTTAVGFFSLMAADTEILRDFGWQSGAGVMFAYLATLFFIPAALSYMAPVERRKSAASDESPRLEGFLMRTGEMLLARPRLVVGASVALVALFAVMASRVEINTTLLEVYDSSHPYFETTKTLEEQMGGFLPIEISLEGDQDDTFKDPDAYSALAALQSFADDQPEVLSTQSLVDFHQSARAALLGDPAQRQTMPDSRAQVEQLQLLLSDKPDAPLGTNNFITSDFQYARLLLRVEDVGAKAQMKLGERLEAELARLFPEDSGVSYRITGDAFVASVALDSFIRDLFYSLFVAVIIIFAMMTFVFRSVKIGAISMLPNIIPMIMTFAYMGWQGIDLNTTTVIIFAISLGLAVDDTIHVLARFREELHRRDTVREAILASYYGAGRAILLTSVLLLLGLSALLTSDFVPTRQFGILTGITIFGAIFADLILLPCLLYLAYRGSEHPEQIM